MRTATRRQQRPNPHSDQEEVRPAPTEARRQRLRKGGQIADKFELPPEMIAKAKAHGMSLEWKRETTGGAADTSYEVFLREQGWQPLDGSFFPNFVSKGHTGPIRREGQILMERPIELTLEAQAEDKANAREAVAVKEQQLGHAADGQFQRHRANGSEEGIINVNRSVESGVPIDQ